MSEFRVDPQEMIATLLALAAERRRPYRMPRGIVEQIKRTRRRNAKARQRAALARRKPGEWRRRAFGDRIQDRMVARMEPGAWYGAKDMARLAGADPTSAHAKAKQILLPAGVVERRRNPNPVDVDHGGNWPIMAPRMIYRLTARGEALREALLLIGV